ncbi:unnamed protein product, partial [marine sediment metagenome]
WPFGIVENKADNADLKKHPKCPGKSTSKKIVYCFGNPARAIHSHFRRKWTRVAFGNLGMSIKVGKNDTFENVVRNQKLGHCTTGVIRQFKTWHNSPTPILFVDFLKYPNESIKAIGEFLSDDKVNTIKIPIDVERCNMCSDEWNRKDVFSVYDPIYQQMLKSHGCIFLNDKCIKRFN